MNRRQKIIVSVTGIFLVLLILVGLTYAYFLTRINGNENETSISVTTANLELVYGDGNGILTPSGVITPGNDIKFKNASGSEVDSKTFTVTNRGNGIVEGYGVILENLIVTYSKDIKVDDNTTIPAGTVTTLNSPSDFTVKITCSSSVSGNTCEGFEGSLADVSNVLLTNDITPDEVHTYTLTMRYEETGVNQSADMNKTISAKVNILDTNNTIDLTGTVANATEGSYIETESTVTAQETSNDKNVNPSYLDEANTSELKTIENKTETKRSYVDKDGKYGVIGLKPGTYKVKYYNSSSTAISEIKTINIVKGEEASVSGDTITITDKSRSIDLSVDANTLVGTLATKVENINTVVNPFDEGTLAYSIINNAANGENGTHYVKRTPTKIAEEISSNNWTAGIEGNVYAINSDIKGYAKTTEELKSCYDPVVDEYGTPLFDCTGVEEYSTCTDEIIGKYIFDERYYEYYKVIGCENGVPIIGKAKYESVLSSVDDDYTESTGLPSYYYRGNVKNNYVNFAGMCWRIIRIVGDGSIKLILEDQYTSCNDYETDNTSQVYTGNWAIGYGNYGYELKNVDDDANDEYIMNYSKPVTRADKSMVKAFYDFQINKLNQYFNKLKSGDWCLGDKAYIKSGSYPNLTYTPLSEYDYLSDMTYDSAARLAGSNKDGFQPTLKCNGTSLDNFNSVKYNSSEIVKEAPMYVGTITADEVVFAGGSFKTNANPVIYLINDYGRVTLRKSFGTLSPVSYNKSSEFIASFNSERGSYSSANVHSIEATSAIRFRPAISLMEGTTIQSGGTGTIDNPYVVN